MKNDENLGRVITKKDIRKMFWRSFTMQVSWNYAKQMSLAYAYCMLPSLKKIYKGDEGKVQEAVKRHLEFFNCTPHICSFILGLSIAMEEEGSTNADFDKESIKSVKTALMGPLSGIGDSFFWGTFRVISAGLGIHFASQGSILGPIVALLAFNIPHLLIRYNGAFIGYKAGTKYIQKILGDGLMERVTYYASVVGLMVVGAMVATFISIKTPLVIQLGQTSLSLQADIFDKIMPSFLPLVAFLIMYKLIKKGVKINYILFGSIAAGILFSWLGIF